MIATMPKTRISDLALCGREQWTNACRCRRNDLWCKGRPVSDKHQKYDGSKNDYAAPNAGIRRGRNSRIPTSIRREPGAAIIPVEAKA